MRGLNGLLHSDMVRSGQILDIYLKVDHVNVKDVVCNEMRGFGINISILKFEIFIGHLSENGE